jgi:D-glycero-D-manno-heptose 1,7-bisphosphate phosphatase
VSARPSAAFLDRDGTINVKAPEGDYIESPEDVRMLGGSAAAVRRLNDAGVPVFVVTNQRGIALGRMTEEDLARVTRRIADELAAEGARVDGWYHCPHDHDACECRKPGTAMVTRAAEEHGIAAPDRAVVVGDSPSDVEMGRRVGATTVLLAPAGAEAGAADAVRASLAEAVDWILTRE